MNTPKDALLLFALTLSFSVISAQSPGCMSNDIQCGICCCVQTAQRDFSAFCSDRELSTLPALGWVEHRVRTLALQRNKFASIHTIDLVARFPRLTLINLSNQKSARAVTLIGSPLDASV